MWSVVTGKRRAGGAIRTTASDAGRDLNRPERTDSEYHSRYRSNKVKLIAAFAFSMAAMSAFGQQSDSDKIARIKKDLAEIADLEASLLAPPPDVMSKYAEFLKTP